MKMLIKNTLIDVGEGEYFQEKTENSFSDKLKNSKEYSIEIKIVPRYNELSFQQKIFSEYAPPMPFIIGPLACYDLGPEIHLKIKESESDSKIFKIQNILDPIIISLKYYRKDKSNHIKIFSNDKLVAEAKLENIQLHRTAKIGNGYSKRLWLGHLEYISIMSDSDEKPLLINKSNVLEYFEKIIESDYPLDIAGKKNTYFNKSQQYKEYNDPKSIKLYDSCIAIKPIYGLANRMRVISSFKVLADYLKIPLLVYWTDSEGFDDSSFNSLFESLDGIELIEQFHWEYYRAVSINLDEWEELNMKLHDTSLEAKQLNTLTTEKIISYKGFREIKNFLRLIEKKLINNYSKKIDQVYTQFKPNKDLEVKVMNVTREFNEYTFGLHIRRGDSVISPQKENYLSSSDQKFIDQIDKIISKYPAAKFFLATDSKSTHDAFIKKYGPRILFFEKEFVTSEWLKPKKGQQEAIVDLFCLSKTKKVLGTNWSTFSLLASKLGAIPLEVLQ